MTIHSYEIRTCNACGLRYPLVEGHPFGTRCPVCMGETRVVVRRELITERSASFAIKEEGRKNMAVLLDNIRSAWNVGSILRSADGFGFAHAYLCGITPTADNEAVTKTSLGAEDSVPWSCHKDAVKLVKGLKGEGWNVYGLEVDARAIPLETGGSLAPPVICLANQAGVPSKKQEQTSVGHPVFQILIVGNEVTGVDPDLLDLCDQILYIPMRGEKKSFNVAIAFSIAAYALTAEKVET